MNPVPSIILLIFTQLEKWMKSRYILTILLMLGMMNIFLMRLNMSVAIVAMADETRNNASVAECGQGSQIRVTFVETPFKWNSRIRAWILGAFYHGYLIASITGGFLERRFGGKIVLGSSMLLSCICSLLIPVMAYQGPGFLITLRIILGVVQGPFIPGLYGLCGKWAPPEERQLMTSVASTGLQAGIILSNFISGPLASSNFLGGWPSIFYVSGASGLMWCVLWAFLAFDSPEVHPRITQDEREFLKNAITQRQHLNKPYPIPWRDIAKSPQVWSLMLALFSFQWMERNLTLNLPSYMHQVLGFDIQSISNAREAWQIVFAIAAAISTLGGIVFMVTVKVEVLPWARIIRAEDERTSDDETRNLIVTDGVAKNQSNFEGISG